MVPEDRTEHSQPSPSDRLRAILETLAANRLAETAPTPAEAKFDTLEGYSRAALVQLEIANAALQEKFKMRRVWAKWLLGALCFLIGFQCVLVVSVGAGWLFFSDFGYLKIQATVYFAEIVGMCAIIVRFLFHDVDHFAQAKSWLSLTGPPQPEREGSDDGNRSGE